MKATSDIEIDALYSDSPFPVRVLFKWLQSVRALNLIARILQGGEQVEESGDEDDGTDRPDSPIPSTPASLLQRSSAQLGQSLPHVKSAENPVQLTPASAASVPPMMLESVRTEGGLLPS